VQFAEAKSLILRLGEADKIQKSLLPFICLKMEVFWRFITDSLLTQISLPRKEGLIDINISDFKQLNNNLHQDTII